MKKIVRLTESGLVNLIRNVLNEQSQPIPGYNYFPNDNKSTKPNTKPYFSCVSSSDWKSGTDRRNFTYVNHQGGTFPKVEPVDYVFYDDGEIWEWNSESRMSAGTNRPNKGKLLRKGKWKCGQGNIEIRWNNDPKAVEYVPIPKDYYKKNLTIKKECATTLNDILKGKYLFKGCRGNGVKELQKILGINPDGVYGDQTKRAVVDFQKSSRLDVDGIVGRDTLVLLQRKSAENGSGNDKKIYT